MPLDPLLKAIVDSTPTEMPRPQGEPPAQEPRQSRLQMALQSPVDFVKGVNRGLTSDLVGAPVDMINLMLKTMDDTRILPQRFSTQKPVGGSEWIHEKLLKAGLAHQASNSPSEAGGRMLGGFLDPTQAPLLLGLMIGAKGARTAGGKYIAQFESGKAALELGRNPQEVMDLYGVFKRHDGSYAMEVPLMAKSEDAIAQFKKFYPNTGLTFARREGSFEGYFDPKEKILFAQGRRDVPMTAKDAERGAVEHELTHGVQWQEGWGAGGRPRAQYKAEPWKDPEYWNNPQEVEARNAMTRLNINERRFLPEDTADVKPENFIIKQDPAAVAEAVKEPGGMWHPEAVERLARPLRERIVYPESVGGVIGGDWSQRAIRNYLNKYAGTSRDPLKDVEIPFGEGVRRWEEVTDDLFRSYSKEEAKLQGVNVKGIDKASPKERIYNIEPDLTYNRRVNDPYGMPHTKQALISYLSHVGDYLRQNVPAEKLQQYDLVRAVKEERAHAARVAKEMEKAAAASMKDLPVYKDYGDGFKWVELKKPERLTKEQMKGVRRKLAPDDSHALEYESIDASGQPIRNSYTGELTGGRTPEEAYLAGQLAQEGNQMGHCVGGYCEGVASGESRIFSLRDAKGKSHVTIEVEPPRIFGRKVPRDLLNGYPDNILQIKGKQNRAPAAAYLPYVQDFVKSGKWGDVGDLGNAGLMPHPTKRGEYLEINKDLQDEMLRHGLQQRIRDANQ